MRVKCEYEDGLFILDVLAFRADGKGGEIYVDFGGRVHPFEMAAGFYIDDLPPDLTAENALRRILDVEDERGEITVDWNDVSAAGRRLGWPEFQVKYL